MARPSAQTRTLAVRAWYWRLPDDTEVQQPIESGGCARHRGDAATNASCAQKQWSRSTDRARQVILLLLLAALVWAYGPRSAHGQSMTVVVQTQEGHSVEEAQVRVRPRTGDNEWHEARKTGSGRFTVGVPRAYAAGGMFEVNVQTAGGFSYTETKFWPGPGMKLGVRVRLSLEDERDEREPATQISDARAGHVRGVDGCTAPREVDHAAGPIMTAAPTGVALTGEFRWSVQVRQSHGGLSRDSSPLIGGYVFALSVEDDKIIDCSVTIREPSARGGRWSLLLPDNGEVVLVGFDPNFKNAIWKDRLDLAAISESKDYGVHYVTHVSERRPSTAGSSAVNLLIHAGWLARHIVESNYSEAVAELTGELLERVEAREGEQALVDGAGDDTPGDSAQELNYSPANRYAPGDGYEYFITVQEYTVNQDIPALLQREFGPDAELAEWNELSALFSSDEDALISFMEGIGMKRSADSYVRSALVTRAGNRFLGGSRHYFVSRHDGRVPSGWAVHAQLHSSRLSLGSWHSDRNALVRIPSDADEQAVQQETPEGLLLDTRYNHQGSSRYYTFYSRGDQLVSQFRDGDVVRVYDCGIKNMTQDAVNPSEFVTRCASGMGSEHIMFEFGVDGSGRAYVDVAGGYRDGSERFYADERRTYTCTVEDAVEIAAGYFGPACDFGSDYQPYDRIALNPHGREAFVMQSCAGPQTRGRFTYLLVERRAPCKTIGSVSGIYDPEPGFTTRRDEGMPPATIGGETIHWASPHILLVETSNGTLTYTFDWDAQEYRRSN